MPKERIYLTDITLHTRDFRQTLNFSKAAQKGRMYSVLPKDYFRNTNNTSNTSEHYRLEITLPKDLQERLDRDEVELMMPKNGLFIYAGKDVYELINKQEEKKRRQLIHIGRTWHADDKGI